MQKSTRLIPLLSLQHGPADIDGPALIRAIHASDPSAAPSLYRIYAGSLRSYLRHNTGSFDVEQSIYTILLEAIRTARRALTATLADLSHLVTELARHALLALRQSPPPHDAGHDVIGPLLAALEPEERAILVHSSLSHDTPEISHNLTPPNHQVHGVRAKVRLYLQTWSQLAHEYDFDPAASA